MKILSKVLIALFIIFFSLGLTLSVFYMTSWYNWGDTPTKTVLIRMVIFWVLIAVGCSFLIVKFFNRKK